jgi:hypothetical protein
LIKPGEVAASVEESITLKKDVELKIVVRRIIRSGP